jgi:hypothetical protein
MTRNAKPGLPRAVDGAMGAPQRFWGGSVIYNGEKVKIALYLAVFVTRDREGYVVKFMVLASHLLRRATEALYLLKNGSFTGSYIYRLWEASIQYYIYLASIHRVSFI